MGTICKTCDRVFGTKIALRQHLRNSTAHAVTFDCDECDRAFGTERALQQHLRDSPAHAVTYDCNECNRAFGTEQALQQHLRDSLKHSTDSHAEVVNDSFDLRPSLHQDVSHQLRRHGLTFDFHADDDVEDIVMEYDTHIKGTFTCTNNACESRRWTSKQIAIAIRQYPGLKYNARVFYQRCQSCNAISRPELDDSYAERVSYRLAKWSGITLEEPPYSGHSQRPHQSWLCEGCRLGHCSQSRL